jgi:hypothetical protein
VENPDLLKVLANMEESIVKRTILIGLLCLLLLLPTGCATTVALTDGALISQTPMQNGATPTNAALISQTSTPNAVRDGITKGEISESITQNDMHLKTSNTVRDVINHPAFAGFGQFILPLDRGRYDNATSLENVATLLPYHSNVDPDAVVNTINALIDAVSSGKTVFYDVYTDQQKQSDPTKESTGLFFFRGEPGAPFAVISPGGGFSYVGSIHEGFPQR